MFRWLRRLRSAPSLPALDAGPTFAWVPPPDCLFRFQRFTEWLKPAVVKGELYYPTQKELNDPCEFSYEFVARFDRDVIRRQLVLLLSMEPSSSLRRASPHLPIDEALAEMRSLPLEQVVDRIQLGMEKATPADRAEFGVAHEALNAAAIGICCFTESGVSTYMSYFYAAHHAGVCLEFSTQHHPFSLAQPVRYQDVPPSLDNLLGPQTMQHRRMFFKASEWAQEREWRLISHRDTDGPTVAYDPAALRSVALCPNFDPANLKVLNEWLSERESLGHPRPQTYRLARVQGAYGLQRIATSLAA